MNYKMLLTDLDGTLLTDDKKILDVDKESISKAISNDMKVIVCSGRSHMSIEKYLIELGLKHPGNYGISYNGGVFYEADTLRKLVEYKLKKELAFKIIEFCRNFDVEIMVYANDKLVIEEHNQRMEGYINLSGIEPMMNTSFNEFIKEDVSKILVLGEIEILEDLKHRFQSLAIYNEVTTFYSNRNLFEFNPRGIDKGNMLLEIADYFNIDTKDIIAIGDNQNDVNMIRQAGLGVAVKNAVPLAKDEADYITKRNNNEGAVSEVLEKFVFI